MNRLDKQYTDLLQDILDNGIKKQDRTGTGTISVFGRQIRHDMKDGFPLLTTKKMPFKTIVTELLWFLRGDTNIKYLVDNGCNIWNGDAYKNYKQSILESFVRLSNDPVIDAMPPRMLSQEEFINKIKTDDDFAGVYGELGSIYGKQWRSWTAIDTSEIKIHTYKVDQIQNLINDLKTNPDSRRLMVNAWNVGELDQMVLPPCHYGFQVYTRELSLEERIIYFRDNISKNHEGWPGNDNECLEFLNEQNVPARAISLMWNQRSCDTFLGLPFNIASYGLLLEIISKEVNMVPDQLIGNLGDVHLYSNHIDAAKEQIGRELTYDEKVEYARSLYGKEEWWDINDKRVVAVLQKKKRTREPFPLPVVKLSSGHNLRAILKGNFEEIEISDIMLINYQSHHVIKAPLSN